MSDRKEKFTEGKWSVYGDWGVITEGQDTCHAEVHYLSHGPEGNAEYFANLRLIAAAPDMYKILKDLKENHILFDDVKDSISNVLKMVNGE